MLLQRFPYIVLLTAVARSRGQNFDIGCKVDDPLFAGDINEIVNPNANASCRELVIVYKGGEDKINLDIVNGDACSDYPTQFLSLNSSVPLGEVILRWQCNTETNICVKREVSALPSYRTSAVASTNGVTQTCDVLGTASILPASQSYPTNAYSASNGNHHSAPTGPKISANTIGPMYSTSTTSNAIGQSLLSVTASGSSRYIGTGQTRYSEPTGPVGPTTSSSQNPGMSSTTIQDPPSSMTTSGDPSYPGSYMTNVGVPYGSGTGNIRPTAETTFLHSFNGNSATPVSTSPSTTIPDELLTSSATMAYPVESVGPSSHRPCTCGT